jgi:serralysin
VADIRLTSGDDAFVQLEANKTANETYFGLDGDDSIRVYRGTVSGGRGNDRIEKIIDPANPGNAVGAAYWDSPVGVVANLAEGWADDGFGTRDTLVGIDNILGNVHDDRVVGNAAANRFINNGGQDHFDGGAGIDTLDCWPAAGTRTRLDELNIRVSPDGRLATITNKTGTSFSVSLVDVEMLFINTASGGTATIPLVDFITPHSLAEDAIAAGGAMRWNAAQPLGSATALTFSFVTQDFQAGFRAFASAEQQAVRDILAKTAQVAGLTFTEVAEGSGTAGQLRFGVTQQTGSKGQAALPGTEGDAAGDVWMDVESMAALLIPGSEGYAALLHEIGHALGLRHPRNTDPGESWAMQLRPQDDRPGLTVMSSQPSADGLFRADWGPLDVLALRYLYGTRDANIADNVYQLGARESSAANTLVDDGGHDTIDASALDSGVSLDLVPGHLGSAGITTAGFAGVENLGIVATSWIEDAIGTAFDDVLIGNDLANTLTGGLGNDWIDGGAGADRAVFAGRRSDYLLSNAFGKLYVEARDGVGGFDTVSGIETLVFIDQALALAIGALGADGEYSVDEDRSLTANLPDPSDVARASASYSLVGQPLHGLAQVSADGQLSYTPAANFNGSDQIVFALTSAGSTNVYQAFVSIRPVNDGPPLARDVTLLAAAGSTLRSSLPQATDVDQDPISYAATAAAKNGVVVVASDGSFSYTAKAGFSGNDSFNFIVGDGRGGTNTYTAAVQVLPVSNTREGTENGDQLLGSPTADALFGYAGNDRLTGAAGDDLIDGGAGIDTSVLAAARARFQLTRTEFGWTLQDNSGTDGNDSITGIERLKFSNRDLALDLDGNAGIVAQVLRALFGKAELANKLYVGVGLKLLDDGMGYDELVRLAIDTPIFESLASGRSNTDFVNWVYRNLVGQAPSTAELQEYVGLLDRGVFTPYSLGLLACQHPLNTGSVELLGLADTGLEFTPQ